jgi:PBSX family phage terminase large subunit
VVLVAGRSQSKSAATNGSKNSDPTLPQGFTRVGSLIFSPKQQELMDLMASEARHICAPGGSRSGKTSLFCLGVAVRAYAHAGSRHLIARQTSVAVKRSVALDTFPKVMRLGLPGVRVKYFSQMGYFLFENGSEVWVAGLDTDEQIEKILGNEYATVYLNEASQIPYKARTLVLTRLAQNIPGLKQREYIDLNPSGKTHWTNRVFGEKRDPDSMQPLSEPNNYVRCFLNPKDNAHNLTPDYLESLQNLPERARRRFWEGEYVDEVEGALWSYEIIEQQRVSIEDIPEEKRARVIVAVDPSGAMDAKSTNDEIGITVICKSSDGRGYVLEDATLRDGPTVWAKTVVNLYRKYKADMVVAESNFGGAMVESTIRAEDRNLRVKLVTASRGKHVRATPVAQLYERKLIHHVGRMSALEDQMCSFNTAGYIGEGSPDRADSMIWGVTELFLEEIAGWGILEHYRREAEKIGPVSAMPPRPTAAFGEQPKTPTVDNGGVRMKAPDGINTAYGASGRMYRVNDLSGIIVVDKADAQTLRQCGFIDAHEG